MTTCVGGYPPAWELCTLWCVCVSWGLFLIRLVVVPTANSSPAALKHNAAWLDKLLFACRLSLSLTHRHTTCLCLLMWILSCEYTTQNQTYSIHLHAQLTSVNGGAHVCNVLPCEVPSFQAFSGVLLPLYNFLFFGFMLTVHLKVLHFTFSHFLGII